MIASSCYVRKITVYIPNVILVLLIAHFTRPLFVSANHIPPGCLSYHKKSVRDSLDHKYLDTIFKLPPAWCRNGRIPDSLNKGSKQLTKAPYFVHTWSYIKSNAIRVKFRSKTPNDNSTFIREIIVQAVIKNSPTPIGQFYHYPEDIQLNCCRIPENFDSARVVRTYPNEQTSSINFLWLPVGLSNDYDGPVVFVATIANAQNQYWTDIESEVQKARKSDKLE